MNDFTESNTFDLVIDFEKGAGNPSRVFSSMANLIDSFQILDSQLAQSVNSSIRTVIVLEEVDKGSIKAKLKTIFEQIPDEPLKNGEVKQIVGHYLHKAKHKVIDWCSEREKIKDRTEIKELEKELLTLATDTDINHIPAYFPIRTEALLSAISHINNAVAELTTADSVSYTSVLGTSVVNKTLRISEPIVKELLTKEIIINEGEKMAPRYSVWVMV